MASYCWFPFFTFSDRRWYSWFFKTNPNLVLIIISIAASLLCLIGTICVYYIIKKKDTAYKTESITNQSNDSNQPRPLADFRIDSVEAEFNIKFREKMISSISFDMVANREGIDYFEKS